MSSCVIPFEDRVACCERGFDLCGREVNVADVYDRVVAEVLCPRIHVVGAVCLAHVDHMHLPIINVGHAKRAVSMEGVCVCVRAACEVCACGFLFCGDSVKHAMQRYIIKFLYIALD